MFGRAYQTMSVVRHEYDAPELRDFVLAALAEDPRALEFAGDALRGDKTVVLEAVRRDGGVLHFASLLLRQDPDVVLAAVRSNGFALLDVVGYLRRDPWTILQAVKQHGFAMVCAPMHLRRDRDFCRRAAECNGWTLRGSPFLDDDEIVSAAVSSRRRAVTLTSAFGDPRLVRPGYWHVAFFLRRLSLPDDVVHACILRHFEDIDKCW